MQKTVAWGVSVVLAAALIGGYYLLRLAAREAPAPAPAVEAPTPRPAAPMTAEPAIRHPIERIPRAPDTPSASPLPPLDASDAELQDSLARLIGRTAFHEFIRPESLVRHIVATVDNLPRRIAAPRLSPVKPIPGPFLSPAGADQPTLAAANAARYAPYVTALESVDAHKLATMYAYFYPLFQQAYRELGYPNGYFNDRLIEAIDVMLATPELREPPALVQPRVLYQFADPDLEALPTGQKIMLRMGPEHAARVRAKLTELRRALTGQAPAGAASGTSAPAPSSTKASGG